ncbi:hypothetical protein G6F31_021414 [Rhizopus arrhizus]|nr:hypothetical protein G6F31_021414 [Rhizopus arrhizus]
MIVPLQRESHVLSGKWAPSRFTYFPVQCRKRLPYAAIARNTRKFATSILDGGVKALHAIRRETWRLIVTTISDQGFGA